jgi:uncharacterized membrane protein YfcA
MELLHILLLVGTVLVAGFTQGATGFGFGILAMSVLPLVLDVREAVPIVSVLGLFVCGTMLLRLWRHVEGRKAWPLLLGVAVGSPVGAYLLTSLDRRLVTTLLGLVLVLYGGGRLALEGRGARPPEEAPAPGRRPGPLWGAFAGLLGGLIGGAFNTGGPPVIVYATASRWPPDAFRANLQVVFGFSTALQLGMFAHAGLLTEAVLTRDAVALPALIVGVWTGTVLASRLDAALFRRIVLALLVVFGIVFLVRAAVG